MLFSLMPRQDVERINALVAERIEQARGSRDPAHVAFIERMDRRIRENAFGEGTDDVASYLMRADFVDNPRLKSIVFEAFRHANDAANDGDAE